MNCIRCGRTISEDALFCPICGGTEQTPRPVLRVQESAVERTKRGKKQAGKAQVPAAQRRLRRALAAVSMLCVVLLAGTAALAYLYFSTSTDSDAQQAANQIIIARQQDDYQAINAALTNTQEQLETAKTTIARQNSRLLLLENLLNETDVNQVVMTLAADNENLTVQLTDSESKMNNLASRIEELTSQISSYKEASEFYTENVFLVNENDTYYHTYNCTHLNLEGNWYPIRLNSQQAGNYRPCTECIEDKN